MKLTSFMRLSTLPAAAIAVLSILALPECSLAQTIRGHTLEAGSGAPISNVLVELIGSDGEPVQSRLTNDRGWFEFRTLPPGAYRIRGERLGYQETYSAFITLRAAETVEIEFRMDTEVIVLDPITVTASPRPWYEHMKPPALWEYYERREYMEPLGIGRFLGPRELETLQGMPVSLAIATVPGIQAVAAENRGNRFHVLGRRGCDVMFFVNGVEVKLRGTLAPGDPDDADFIPGPEPLDWFIDDLVSLSQVEAIEVYRGPSELPGEFHSFHGGGNCGAVVVWTKRTVEPSGGDSEE